MEFGISLDPLSVTQRHTLHDSDEEDEARAAVAAFSITPTAGSDGIGTLLVALGQYGVAFVRSFLNLSGQASFQLTSSSSKVVKGLYFPIHGSDSEESLPVSTSMVYEARRKGSESDNGGQFMVCTHEQPLNSEYCNLWAAEVC